MDRDSILLLLYRLGRAGGPKGVSSERFPGNYWTNESRKCSVVLLDCTETHLVVATKFYRTIFKILEKISPQQPDFVFELSFTKIENTLDS